MAEIVVCCDGTWNTPDDLDLGLPAPTNVVKIRNAIAKTDAAGTEQKIYYHPGVGTDGGWWDRIAGGGMGEGLEKNVVSAYRWLAGAYRPGDRIWLFGFSRGAFTVRSLSGMISRCGLLDASGMTEPSIWAACDEIFAAYRAKKSLKATAKRPFHNTKSGEKSERTTPIHFTGVWDTVGARGIPDDMALLNLIDDPRKYEFHDTNLSPIVAHARHAVAIDEMRQSFMPTLWTDDPPPQDLAQVWFPGVHSDVGGGYSSCGLSDGALLWMIEEAKKAGLSFRAEIGPQIAPDPRGVLHDSLTGVFKALKSRPRAAPRIDQPAGTGGIVHESAIDRHLNPSITQSDYWPTTILGAKQSARVDVPARNHWNATGLYLEAGVRYAFAADGEWIDGDVPSGPGGASDGKFHLGEAVHIASSVWGKAETLYKMLTKNQQADFWWTLREEAFDWFELIGVVANGVMPKGAADALPHAVFRIGKKASFAPSASGYLYCFANDAWQTYGNNRGSVRLTVSR